MSNKERYEQFCASTYIPIYSKPWWMDAVCGPENWDVWLYESGGTVLAAMPYYMEQRGPYRYITKAPLTQNNGIIFKEEPNQKLVTKMEMQERIINAACAFIQSLGLDVYEQQYHYSFQNWQPFFWNHYTNVLRYTYVIDPSNLEEVTANISKSYRNKIKNGQKQTHITSDISPEAFFEEHEKVFLRQGLPCPFSKDLWFRLYEACRLHDSGQMFCAKDREEHICALLFLVWDERSAYQLLGGYMQEYANCQGHPALIYNAICIAHEKGLLYDFEGSMIQRIAHSRRQFGGVPTPYYRIRKVFNPEIVRKEAEDYIKQLQSEDAEHKFC